MPVLLTQYIPPIYQEIVGRNRLVGKVKAFLHDPLLYQIGSISTDSDAAYHDDMALISYGVCSRPRLCYQPGPSLSTCNQLAAAAALLYPVVMNTACPLFSVRPEIEKAHDDE